MAPKIKWNQMAVEDVIDKVEERIGVVAEYYRGAVVKNISTPTRTAGPSKPGEFPHADTGRMRQSIFVADVPGEPLAKRVGTNVDYAVIHETGERPFMRPTLIQELPTMKRIVRDGGGELTINEGSV